MSNTTEKTKQYKVISSELIRKASYQRPEKQQWVNEIVKNWNELKAHAPKVSFRDGAYWVFDGQHTLEARIRRNNGKPVFVECEVYYGLTEKEEAELFVSLNDDRKQVTVNERLKAKYISGDEETSELFSIITKHGFKPNYNGGAKPGYVRCLSTALSIMRRDKEALDWVLGMVKKIWNDDVNALNQGIIGGLAEFYWAYIDDSRFDHLRLVRGLQAVMPSTILREGKEMAVGGNKRFAKRIVFYYNKGLKTYKLDISKLD